MNRKEFFKKLGLGALVVAVAPKVLAQENESHLLTVSRSPDKEDTFKDGAWYSRTYKYDVVRGETEFFYSKVAMEADYELSKMINDELFRNIIK